MTATKVDCSCWWEPADAPRPAGRPTPRISVVICTRNRPASLLSCVDTVLGQTALPCELIVVDDGELPREDRDTLSQRCATAGLPLVYLRKEVPGLPASRNLAVRHASGDIIQFLDDDVELEPDFCRQILRLYLLDTFGSLAGVGGTLRDAKPSTTARAFGLLYRLAGFWALKPKTGRRPPLARPLRDTRWAVPAWTLSGACMSFRRSVLGRHAFDEGLAGYALGEDRDMCLRLSVRGQLLVSRSARAVHHHDAAGRPDHFQFGRMTVLNYTRIMQRIGRCSVGDHLVIAYALVLMALGLGFCSILKPRRYLPELLGVLGGTSELLRSRWQAALADDPPGDPEPASAGGRYQPA